MFCCWALSGCVVGSIEPFYTPDLVVQKPELYGRWDFDDRFNPQANSQIILSAGKLTIFDKEGNPLDAKITFFMVEDSLFIDVFPDDGKLKADLVGELPPVHLIGLLKPEADKMTFIELDYDWLSQEVQSGRIKLRYTKDGEFTDVLFTPSSQEWVEFLKAYRHDPKAFSPDTENWLIRKPEFQQSMPQ